MARPRVVLAFVAVVTLAAAVVAQDSALPACSGTVREYVARGSTFEASAALALSSPFISSCAVGTPLRYEAFGASAAWSVDATTGAVVFSSAAASTDSDSSSFAAKVFCGGPAHALCVQRFSAQMYDPLTMPPTPAPSTMAPSVAPATTAPAPTAATCRDGAYGFNAPVGSSYAGSLEAAEYRTQCPDGQTPTYALLPNGSNSAAADLSADGSFVVPAKANEGFFSFDFALSCGGASVCDGRAYVLVSRYVATPAPVPACAASAIQVVPAGTETSFAAAAVSACEGVAELQAITSATRGMAMIDRVDSGVLRYAAPSSAGADNFTVRVLCAGSPCIATVRVSVVATAAPTTMPPATTAAPGFHDRPLLHCTGSCLADAFAISPFDAAPIDAARTGDVTTSVAGDRLTVTASGTIGNVVAMFPSFELVRASATRLTSVSAGASTPFNSTCLDEQVPYGVGEQVWQWTNLSAREGKPAGAYAAGNSYYQKFGGKHDRCDTFINSCKYAPLLTPVAPWSLSVDGCRTQWAATFALADLLAMRLTSGEPTWTARAAAGGRVTLSTTVLNEAIAPASWVQPSVGTTQVASRTPVNVSAQILASGRVVAAGDVAPRWTLASLTVNVIADGASPTTLGVSALLVPLAPVTDAISDVVVTSVAWDQATRAGCGAACASRSLTCRAQNLSSAGSCSPDSMAFGVSLGAAAERPCMSTKPFSPIGVAGIADTTCDPLSVASRALNVSFVVRMNENGAFAIPTGAVELAIVAGGAGQPARVDTLTVELGSQLLSADAANPGAEVSVCRVDAFPVNPFAPISDPPGGENATCGAVEGFLGPEDYVVLSAGAATERIAFVTVETREGAATGTPLFLANDSVVTLPTRLRALPLRNPASAPFAGIRRPSTTSIGFNPGPLCPALRQDCFVTVTLGIASANGTRTAVAQLVVDPLFTYEVRTGQSAAQSKFIRVLAREEGSVRKRPVPTADHAALSLAFVLFGAIFFVGALTVYTSDGAKAVLSEHGRVMSHYVKKVTGVQLASPTSGAPKKAAKRAPTQQTAPAVPRTVSPSPAPSPAGAVKK